MSFDKLYYNGEEVVSDVDDSAHVMHYQHIYSASFNGNGRKHMCLQYGDWCWKQSLKRPDEAIRFLVALAQKKTDR